MHIMICYELKAQFPWYAKTWNKQTIIDPILTEWVQFSKQMDNIDIE
jgi:hypothetical protein